MSRLRITPWENSQRTVDDLYADMERRISAAPCGNCPVELTSAFLKLCLAQSCGKCVPCRIGLDRLAALLDQLLDGQGSQADLDTILRTAQSIVDSADCAIGFEAAQMVLDGYVAFQDDYLAHVTQGSCTANFKSVPCVELCPAHVDVPGYISLVGEERYDDAIRLIRKDNPFPSVCGLVCEHPCETHCRRTIVDSPLNIRGIKRFAVDHAGEVPAPPRAPSSGKTVAIVGGGPGGVAFGLKMLFGDAAHCFFAEPTHSPCMMLGMATGENSSVCVQDFGIDNRTAADGLAVGRASGFVGGLMRPFMSGCYTLQDERMYPLLAQLADAEDLYLEPSALAGMYGPVLTQPGQLLGAYTEAVLPAGALANATHLVWATGGNMVPREEMQRYYAKGKALAQK